MLGVKGIVGSYIPLVANFSVWETSGISGILVRGPTGRGRREVKNVLWLIWLGSDSREA